MSGRVGMYTAVDADGTSPVGGGPEERGGRDTRAASQLSHCQQPQWVYDCWGSCKPRLRTAANQAAAADTHAAAGAPHSRTRPRPIADCYKMHTHAYFRASADSDLHQCSD